MQHRFYRPELDVIRLVAFLAVFYFHTVSGTSHAGGIFFTTVADASSFGLPLFFVLSAYLITTLLLREREATGTIAIGRFYERRILRIWPLYFGALLLGVFISIHHHLFYVQWRWYLAALLMCGNLTSLPITAFRHLWSISVEEQFYVIWPTLMRSLTRLQLVAAAVALIVITNSMLVYDSIHHVNVYFVLWFNSFVQFEMFAAGILLAIVTADQRTWLTSTRTRILLAALAPALCLVAESFSKIRHDDLVSPLPLCLGFAAVAASCALLIYALLGSSGWPKWLVHMGKVSYGLYVFHMPVLTFVRQVAFLQRFWLMQTVALCLTSTLALLSYRFFETPFLKLKQRLEIIPSRPIEVD